MNKIYHTHMYLMKTKIERFLLLVGINIFFDNEYWDNRLTFSTYLPAFVLKFLFSKCVVTYKLKLLT